MTASTTLSTLALAISMICGGFAIHAANQTSKTSVNQAVDARIAERESKFVRAATPKLRSLFEGMGDDRYGADWNPSTLEELLAPIMEITTGMTPEP